MVWNKDINELCCLGSLVDLLIKHEASDTDQDIKINLERLDMKGT